MKENPVFHGHLFCFRKRKFKKMWLSVLSLMIKYICQKFMIKTLFLNPSWTKNSSFMSFYWYKVVICMNSGAILHNGNNNFTTKLVGNIFKRWLLAGLSRWTKHLPLEPTTKAAEERAALKSSYCRPWNTSDGEVKVNNMTESLKQHCPNWVRNSPPLRKQT